MISAATDDKKYDVFICHAREDKGAVARPLAEALASYGVVVWYDDLTLKLGDSLSRSIDEGLAKSNFGLVILSPSFFAKNWPEYELRGLTAKEIGGQSKVILPIWHQVDFEDVVKYSPPLADKLAVKTSNKSLDEIAQEVIAIIRPDLLTKIHKRIAYLESLKTARLEVVEASEIKVGPIKHQELPPDLISRIRLIRAALLGVHTHSMKFWVDGFRRDSHPSTEIRWWEHVASCFLEFTQMTQLESQAEFQAAYDIIFTLAMSSGHADVKEQAAAFPEDSLEKLKNLVQYRYPAYDFDDSFPNEVQPMDEHERKKWLNNFDLEDFESLDRTKLSGP